MIVPDPSKRTVKIPIRIADGKAEYFYGGPFPKLKNTIGDLIVPAYSVLEETFEEECSETDGSMILPEGTRLMINVRAESNAVGLVKDLNCGPLSGNVEVQLLEDLYLWHRGTKSSVLDPCRCLIPAIGEEATSLNHAYTIISKRFETKRQTNTGNVFKKAYFQVTETSWTPLQVLRDRYDAKFEQRFVADHRGQETVALRLADSGVIEQHVLHESNDHRIAASIDASGLTIEEHRRGDSGRQVRQKLGTSSLNRVLLELLKDTFTSVSGFDSWLALKGIPVDIRSETPNEAADDLIFSVEGLLAIFDEPNSQAVSDSDHLEIEASGFGDFDQTERAVEVDRESACELDEYLADGWIHAGNQFKRRPLMPTKTIPFLNIPARIRLSDFRLSKQQRRVLKKNLDVETEIMAHAVTPEEEQLFERHKVRFAFAPPKSIHDVIPISSLTEIKEITVRMDGCLLAASYLDVGRTATYSIYGMFEPTIESRSLGILTILKEIEFSIAHGKEFYYLGFVYDFPSFYDYKKQFYGLELYDWKGNWTKQARLAEKRRYEDSED